MLNIVNYYRNANQNYNEVISSQQSSSNINNAREVQRKGNLSTPMVGK